MKKTNKTTLKSIFSDLNRWYGDSWWQGGLVLFAVFAISVVLPGILG